MKEQPTSRCPHCAPWVSKDWAQWHLRQRRLRENPQVLPYACDQCGSTDWVSRHPPAPPDRDWRRWAVLVAVWAIVAWIIYLMVTAP